MSSPNPPENAAKRAVITGSMVADEIRQRRRSREQSRAKVPCNMCDGTGTIAVHFRHGVQEQDCPACDCSGVQDAD